MTDAGFQGLITVHWQLRGKGAQQQVTSVMAQVILGPRKQTVTARTRSLAKYKHQETVNLDIVSRRNPLHWYFLVLLRSSSQ